MKVRYDKQADALYIKLSEAEIVESDSEKAGMILDYDKNSNIVGIEILNASQKMEKPLKVDYELV